MGLKRAIRLAAVSLTGAVFALALTVPALSKSTAGTQTAPSMRAGPEAAQSLPAGFELPNYAPGPNPFRDGERLVYQVSWLGIPAATAQVKLHRNRKNPSLWTAQAWIQTNRVVDVLFRMRDYVKEDLLSASFAPLDLYISQHENRRRDEYKVTFDHRARLVTMVKTNRQGRRHVRRVQASDPWGPLSGAIMALSQPLNPGDVYAFHVFTGTTNYVFDFHVVGREKISTSRGIVDAIRIVPAVKYVSSGKLGVQARQTTLWVSADKRRLPLRVESQVFIGTVRADLVEVDG
jgi:hypothetical protein